MIRIMNTSAPRKGRPFPYWRLLAGAALALSSAACASSEKVPEDTLGPNLPQDARACDVDDDCRLIYSDCLGCEREALNEAAVDKYRRDRQKQCADYLGPFGDCDAPVIVARCEQKVCVVKESAEVDTVVTAAHEVEVPSNFRECKGDIDCTSVETGCDGCCQAAAVSENALRYYEAEQLYLCSGFQGGQCDCQPETIVPVCKNGSCVAK